MARKKLSPQQRGAMTHKKNAAKKSNTDIFAEHFKVEKPVDQEYAAIERRRLAEIEAGQHLADAAAANARQDLEFTRRLTALKQEFGFTTIVFAGIKGSENGRFKVSRRIDGDRTHALMALETVKLELI